MTYVRYISIIVIIAGSPLVSAPWWWPEIVGGDRAWSNAQANKYSQAAANFHRLAHDSSQKRTEEASAAASRYYQEREVLEHARSSGQTTARVMQCLGILTVFAGLCGYSAAQQGAKSA